MKDLKELEKKYEELGKEIERLKQEKKWPDTLGEAKRKYKYIGFKSPYGRNDKYFLTVMNELIQAGGRWGEAKNTNKAYEDYCDEGWFYHFDSRKELYEWLLEGE